MNGLAARLPDIVKILLIIGIAYTIATTIWHFVSGPEQPSIVTSDAPVSRSANAGSVVDVQSIIGANIFGDVSAAPVEAAEPEEDDTPARETRLPLTLLGVFQAEHAEDSAAIVAQKGKAGLRYAVGQTMPGNAKLVEVLADHIILRRAGLRETLRFPKSDSLISNSEDSATTNSSSNTGRIAGSRSRSSQPRAQGGAKITPPTRNTATGNRSNSLPTSAKEVVAQYRDKLSADPAGTLNSMGVKPVSDGDAQGYQLGGLANSPYLAKAGLQSGDVLLSVNGRAVGDVGLDQMRIDSVLAEGSARLEIMRGERRFFVTAALK